MEGSLRAVNRTAAASADVPVGFNVFPRYRDSVSELFRLSGGDSGRKGIPVPAECREQISEIRWYHGFEFALSIQMLRVFLIMKGRY